MISILAGRKKGARLSPCDSPSVRPTSQRTREALFNILAGGRLDCVLEGGFVIDIFAGSGALGLEALSRGAGKAVFIEKDPSAVRVIRRNCEILDCAEDTHILTTDACQIASWRFDVANIIFCDAPYDSGLSLPALDALNKAGGIGADTIIAVETRRKEPELSGGDFTLLDSRHYGIARLSFYKLS